MNETQKQVEIIRELLKAYIDLNKIHASPGDKAHMVAYSIHYIERRIKELLK